MNEALLVSNIALWIAVVVLAGVVLALARQIGVLHERVSPVGALVGGEGPRAGEPAPVIELEDWNGRRVRVGGPVDGGEGAHVAPTDAAGPHTLLFFLSPSCPVCKTLLPVLAALRASEKGLRLVFASDGERAEHEAFVAEHGLDRETYITSTDLGLAYRVGRLPYAVLIDAAGIVRARGLVNTREHLESLFEASALGVASVQEYHGQAAGEKRVA